jgi:hypothetical protein
MSSLPPTWDGNPGMKLGVGTYIHGKETSVVVENIRKAIASFVTEKKQSIEIFNKIVSYLYDYYEGDVAIPAIEEIVRKRGLCWELMLIDLNEISCVKVPAFIDPPAGLIPNHALAIKDLDKPCYYLMQDLPISGANAAALTKAFPGSKVYVAKHASSTGWMMLVK